MLYYIKTLQCKVKAVYILFEILEIKKEEEITISICYCNMSYM